MQNRPFRRLNKVCNTRCNAQCRRENELQLVYILQLLVFRPKSLGDDEARNEIIRNECLHIIFKITRLE